MTGPAPASVPKHSPSRAATATPTPANPASPKTANPANSERSQPTAAESTTHRKKPNHELQMQPLPLVAPARRPTQLPRMPAATTTGQRDDREYPTVGCDRTPGLHRDRMPVPIPPHTMLRTRHIPRTHPRPTRLQPTRPPVRQPCRTPLLRMPPTPPRRSLLPPRQTPPMGHPMLFIVRGTDGHRRRRRPLLGGTLVNDPYRIPVEPLPADEWRSQALCAQVDTDVFFPDHAGASGRDAKQICRLCPVRLECLQEARDRNERFGVWGGLSERERRALKRPLGEEKVSRPLSPIPLPERLSHGTRAAYNAGCKCRACCAADGHYQRNRHTRRGNYGGAA